MSSLTRLSAKGQVVIPKAMRDALGLQVGQEFDVIASAAGVLLRPKAAKSRRSFEEVTAAIRDRIKYDGPPVSIEDMDRAVGEMWASGGPRWDK